MQEMFLISSINCNVDLIVKGTHFFTKLNVKPSHAVNHALINTIDEFRETFAYYFQKGLPAERFFTNKEAFNKIIKSAEMDYSAEVSLLGV